MAPTVPRNVIRDSLDDGVYALGGAAPNIQSNLITGNAFENLRVEDAPGAIIKANRVGSAGRT